MTNGMFPAVFRAGDIGVSSEWRDLSYDWPAVLTAAGVSIYSYLRDTYDRQRSLRPFILNPDGPTKTQVQQLLGYRTNWAIQGPEYLLATVGLLHVETGYGASIDPERPRHTRVAYYVVGRLDHPVLDWPMMSRVLDSLVPALAPSGAVPASAEVQRKAQAALRSLGQAGMFQNVDPEDLFYPFGAWPSLLPTLVEDERWSALFAHLHGADAVEPYRRQARAWVEYTQRAAMRLARENQAIGEQLLAAQRRGVRSGAGPRTAQQMQPASDMGIDGSQIVATPADEAVRVIHIAPVAPLSLACRQAVRVTHTASATPSNGAHQDAQEHTSSGSTRMSLRHDQLINGSRKGEIRTPTFPATRVETSDTAADRWDEDALPLVAPHVRDAELATTRQDAQFWCEIHRILCGASARYDHSPGERQAALRRFKKPGIPVGVVLAALRAMMTLPPAQRPARFGDALKMEIFHACVQQALALLPERTATATSGAWQEFLHAYRRIGPGERLRDVSTTDYHVLHALFTRQPDACWEVLSRAEHAAEPPALSPAYLRRAIINNQRAAAQQAMLQVEQPPACGRAVAADAVPPPSAIPPSPRPDDDPRRNLLEQEGLPTSMLAEDITEGFVRAWIAEADARRAEIRKRPNWLRWGLSSGCLPQDHPDLCRRVPSAAARAMPERCSAGDTSASLDLDPALAALWQTTLDVLQDQLARGVFNTWVAPCRLVALEPGEHAPDDVLAIVAAPNIFVRQELEANYLLAITQALQAQLGRAVEVEVVIGG